jgi:hypothetical protein
MLSCYNTTEGCPVLFQSSTIPSCRKHRQDGFALALVLVVVALIGMIVASISLDTSSTQATATANEDRLAAGTLTRIGSAAGDALNTMIYSKGNRVETIFADREGNQDTTQNILGRFGTWKIPQTNINAYAYDTTSNPYGNETPCAQNDFQNIESRPAVGVYCFIYFTRVITSLGSRGNTPTNSTYIIYSGMLKTSVGLQINNLLWQDSLTQETVPTTTGVKIGAGVGGLGKISIPGVFAAPAAGLPTVLIRQGGEARTDSNATPFATPNAPTDNSPGLPVINGAQRPEGCYDSNGVANDDVSEGNYYYKVLLAL